MLYTYPPATSVTRLPPPERDALPPEDQAVWDRIAAVRSGVRGPFGVLMRVPQLADRVRALEDHFRFDGELLGADRELVILVTAREMEARYAWARHEHRALEEGTRPEAVEAVRANAAVDSLTNASDCWWRRRGPCCERGDSPKSSTQRRCANSGSGN